MKLRSSERALYGQSINCLGTIYQIDREGTIEGVSAEHATRLLQIPGYYVIGPDGTVQMLPVSANDRQAQLAAMSARELMKIARSLGLRIVGRSKAELARDILECEKKESESKESGDGEEPAET